MSPKMNHDQQTILAAYDDAIRKLYATLFEQYIEAQGEASQEQQAVQRFTTGFQLAQRTRDRAVATVG